MKPGSLKFLSCLLVFAFLFNTISAQNITGIWRGYFIANSGDQYKYELQIEQTKDNRIKGVSYSYLSTIV
jgi:hypothetical protein